MLSNHSHVHQSSTFNCLQELSLCIQNLAVWYMPSSVSLITSSFWFKVREVWLFLSLGTLRGHCRLSTVLISLLLYLRERRGLRRNSEWHGGMTQSVEQSEHTHFSSLLPYMGTKQWHGSPKQQTIIASKITDHR